MATDETDRVIRVVVVDDHYLVRQGLSQLLAAEPDIDVVGQAGDGAQAVELVRAAPPDVVLMDLSMPGLDGVGATAAITAAHRDVAVLVLTSVVDGPRVDAALQAGAIGYLLKDSEPATLVAGVRAAAAGHAPIDPRVARVLLPSRPPPVRLSDRETEVLGLVADGLANKQIGRRLGITERTVKNHLGSAFRAIGVQDRVSAALWARQHL